MNILFVCSGNAGHFAPFIHEQAESLRRLGASVDHFFIKGHGYAGYLKNHPRYMEMLRRKKYDVVHAHYGLSGMLAVLQHKAPVVTTFHGTDVGRPEFRMISRAAGTLSNINIFVASHMVRQLKPAKKRKDRIIPCGVDLNVFYPMPSSTARREMKLDGDKPYILFAGSFQNRVKNYALAEKAVDKLGFGAELIELTGYTRKEVHLLMNAVNALIVTSFYEGSPQVVKEALACNTPVVSVDVGDVARRLDYVKNCHIADFNPKSLALKLERVLTAENRAVNGRETVLELGLDEIAEKIMSVYESVVSRPRYALL